MRTREREREKEREGGRAEGRERATTPDVLGCVLLPLLSLSLSLSRARARSLSLLSDGRVLTTCEATWGACAGCRLCVSCDTWGMHVQAADVDLRPDFYKHIVLSGTCTSNDMHPPPHS